MCRNDRNSLYGGGGKRQRGMRPVPKRQYQQRSARWNVRLDEGTQNKATCQVAMVDTRVVVRRDGQISLLCGLGQDFAGQRDALALGEGLARRI
jgi:hypothetical protein